MRPLTAPVVLLALGCASEPPEARAFLESVDAHHAAADSASFARRRSTDRLAAAKDWAGVWDHLVYRRNGDWRRQNRDYTWGEDQHTWWGWSERSGEVYLTGPARPPGTAARVPSTEPFGEVLPPYGDLAARFVASAVHEEGGLTTVTLVPRAPLTAWYDHPQRPVWTLDEVELVFDADLLPVRSTRHGPGGLTFVTAFEDVVLDDPRIDDADFAQPTSGGPRAL